MTILEIRDRVEAGEAVQIASKYWGIFHEQAEAHIDRACWHISVANGVITITKEVTQDAE